MTREEGIRYLLEKVKEDEPVFILRGRDSLADEVVRYWARIARTSDVNELKCDEASVCAARMLSYSPRRLPD
jgi:hypothetical protein